MEQVLVSVIIPVYNAVKYLRDTINSIINQKGKYEIILVNDGSTDGSGKLCDILSNEYNNIRVIHQSNHGVSYSRNVGIREAKGKFIHFVDADDVVLDNLYTIKELNLNCDLLFIGYFREKANGSRQANLPITNTETFLYDYIRGKFRLGVYSCLVNRNYIVNNKICFDETAYYGEDINFILNCFILSSNCLFVEKPYYVYKYNIGSTVNRAYTSKLLSSLPLQINFINKLVSKNYNKKIINGFICLLKLSLIRTYRKYLKNGIYIAEDEHKLDFYYKNWFRINNGLIANYRSIFVFLCWLVWKTNKKLYKFLLRKV